MEIYNICDFGAIGDGIFDNASSIQKAIDTCSLNGGGTVLVPPGNYMAGPFNLKSNIEFKILSNAVIIANPNEEVYTQSAFKDNYGEGSIWIGGVDATNVTLCGQGTLDGNGIEFMGPEEKSAYVLKEFEHFDRRPHLFTPINFQNLIIKDLTFKNSAYWCIHLVGCNDVNIEGIKIYNNLKIRNSDGIDPDHSKNVRISNCYIESGDDCICPKTRREYEEFGPTENIVVTNCILKSTSCSIKLGSENMDAIRNVVFSNCIITGSNRAIGIQNRDEGIVENILFENIIIDSRFFDEVWWGKAEPIYITAYKRQPGNARDANWRFAKGQLSGNVGMVRNIQFINITAASENGVFVGGEPNKISGIKFLNVNLEISKKSKYPGGKYDLRPSDTVGILNTDTSGFHIEYAKDITIKDSSVLWSGIMEDYYGSAVFAQEVDSLTIDGFKGESAFPNEKETFVIRKCENFKLKN